MTSTSARRPPSAGHPHGAVLPVACSALRPGLVLALAVALAPSLAVGGCGALFPEVAADAGGSGAAAALERLDASGREALGVYAAAPPNKAFAIADGGAWGWRGAAGTLAAAQEDALARCGSVSAGQPCRVVAWDAGGALGDPQAAGGPPQDMPALDDPGVTAFQTFLAAEGNKAFAVSPDGAWGWRASSSLPLEAVQEEARQNCARHADACDVVVTAPDLQGLASLPR